MFDPRCFIKSASYETRLSVGCRPCHRIMQGVSQGRYPPNTGGGARYFSSARTFRASAFQGKSVGEPTARVKASRAACRSPSLYAAMPRWYWTAALSGSFAGALLEQPQRPLVHPALVEDPAEGVRDVGVLGRGLPGRLGELEGLLGVPPVLRMR